MTTKYVWKTTSQCRFVAGRRQAVMNYRPKSIGWFAMGMTCGLYIGSQQL